MAALVLVTPPAGEPVSFADMQAQLRLDSSTESALVQEYITAARRYVEVVLRRALITQTWDLLLDAFPRDQVIRLPLAPVQSVTSITYYDTTDTQQTLIAQQYIVDTASEPARITPAIGQWWPATSLRPNSVAVRFVCGYGSAANVPRGITHAIKLLVAHWFEQREPVVSPSVHVLPFALDSLLWQYRMMEAI